MGKDFTDGPRGEAERTDDGAGTTTHRPQDNRNISGSKAGPLAERLEDREVKDVGPPEEGADSAAGIDKAAGVFDRLRERGVAHERHPEHRDGFVKAKPEEAEVEEAEEESFEDEADPAAAEEDDEDFGEFDSVKE